MQHEPIDLLEQLELVIPVVKHRRLLNSTRSSNWLFNLYFGPSFSSLYSDKSVQVLEYTVSGYTDDLTGGPEPSMPDDHSGIFIKFNNKGFASWTSRTKEAVLTSTKISFDNQLSLDTLEGE